MTVSRDTDGWWIVDGVRVRVDAAGEIRELRILDPGGPITGVRLRRLKLGTIERQIGAVLAAPAVDRVPLTAPDREHDHGDTFYERVAEAYRAANSVRAPVAALAEEAGVPISRAQRWVKEARRRGKLGPAPRKGKAGERP